VLVERGSIAPEPFLQSRETPPALGDSTGLGVEGFRD
jgi:hypothetical protein